MANNPSRRRFVLGAGTVGASLLAGCTSFGGPGGSGTTTDGEMTDGEMTDGGMAETTSEQMTDGEMTDDEMTDAGMMGEPTDPADAPRASIDRFSDAAGTLMVRDGMNELPGPDEPIDFDEAPFITQGFGPDGEHVQYYNFDVQPTEPAPIYVLFREGDDAPVADQLNVVDVVPGDDGYNDFWHVHRVTVPSDYSANTVASVADIEDAGYGITATDALVNCPVVPDGSTASLRFNAETDTGLVEGWYQDQVVSYFNFPEASLSPMDGSVPVSPIWVAFNTNPGEDGGGPPSGFKTEGMSAQTHNVVATLPGDDEYSPLWLVNIYDNADFDDVADRETANMANVLVSGAATVNCPIVSAM